MTDGGLTVLDGTHLRSTDASLPESDVTFTGAQLLHLADNKTSSSLFGFSLPENLKSAAFARIAAGDSDGFRSSVFDRDQASSKLNDYIKAIADELQENPLVVSVLDGKTLRIFLEDEDDFAMLAENLFTDLDTEDKGKISKGEIRSGLVHMGVDMGVPPISEFPPLNDILEKHGVDGEGELGQAQFAQLLQPILQELADALAQKKVVAIQNIKVINGSKLRKLLANEKQLNDITEKILQKKRDEKIEQKDIEVIRYFLEKHGKELGLPPSESNEAVGLLYDAVFSDDGVGPENDELGKLVKQILEKFAEELEANPVFHDLDY